MLYYRSVLFEINNWLFVWYAHVWWKMKECKNNNEEIKFTQIEKQNNE